VTFALLRAGLSTAVTDGLFSTALSVFFYHSTASRLWQGVASTVLGPRAIDGGMTPVLAGVLMHVAVAFAWSMVFLVLAVNVSALRSLLTSTGGIFAAAAIYGPLVWIVMSLAVVPALTHRQPPINTRWWIQFFGHMAFVGLPIVATFSRGVD
jgi:hypothetical protein